MLLYVQYHTDNNEVRERLIAYYAMRAPLAVLS